MFCRSMVSLSKRRRLPFCEVVYPKRGFEKSTMVANPSAPFTRFQCALMMPRSSHTALGPIQEPLSCTPP